MDEGGKEEGGWRDLPDAGALTMQQRDAQIGGVVQQARLARGISRTKCAESLGIERDTLDRKESGKSSFSVPELERLAKYLRFPLSAVFPRDLEGAVGEGRYVLVTAQAGESVQIVINIEPGEEGGTKPRVRRTR